MEALISGKIFTAFRLSCFLPHFTRFVWPSAYRRYTSSIDVSGLDLAAGYFFVNFIRCIYKCNFYSSLLIAVFLIVLTLNDNEKANPFAILPLAYIYIYIWGEG